MKTIRSCIACGLLVMTGFATLHADSVANTIGLSGIAAAGYPLGDHSVMDHTGDVGHDFGGMLRIGLTPKWSMGVSYDNINLLGKEGERHHPETILGNVLLHMSPDSRWVPTLQLGVGAASPLTDGAFDKFSVRSGLGFDYFFSPNFSAGPHLDYTFIENSSNATDEYHILSAGLMVSLFLSTREKEPPPAATPPPPAVVAAPVVAPPPPPPPPVQENVSIELKILFDTGKSVVKPNYRSEIQKVADFMNTYPESTGEIEGHTDNTGSAALNKRLSQERADAVRNYLIKEFQIDPSRITALGYGEEGPVADNATREGQEKNRRVVATLHAVKIVHPTP